MKQATERLLALLRQLYPGEDARRLHQRILDLLSMLHAPESNASEYFSERNVTLITYGDTLRRNGEAPLYTLHHFLRDHLPEAISTVHILPCYRYSSDDGFSVIDYYAINPDLGTWEDVRRLGADFRLMLDAVINHMSVKSVWFQEFLAGEPSFEHLFLTESPDMDPRSVTRPRTTPLLTPFQRPDGSTVYVWTTFSADQADFDYRDPETLLRILQVLLFYVEQGAQALRLDAIAYLWKQVGTSCIHLPQTHAVIQLMRAVFDLVAPQVVLITETNVPHAENIAYFGSPDFPEAQLIYNFTLPPLLLHTLLSGNAHLLCDWVNTLDAPAEQTTFFNFTASHDGIGVRPVEGILSAEQLTRLIAHVERCGGRVSYKANPDGSRSPYELNITYVDATAGQDAPPDVQVRRFLVSQAVMLALAGVPAIYIHSLLGSRNDVVGMQQAGYPRAINRQKLPIDDVLAELADPSSFRAQVFQGYLNLIRARRQTPAFHPRAGQSAFDLSDGGVFALERIARAGTERVLCLFNITDKTQAVETGGAASVDLLSGEVCGNRVTLEPYQVRWLRYHR